MKKILLIIFTLNYRISIVLPKKTKIDDWYCGRSNVLRLYLSFLELTE